MVHYILKITYQAIEKIKNLDPIIWAQIDIRPRIIGNHKRTYPAAGTWTDALHNIIEDNFQCQCSFTIEFGNKTLFGIGNCSKCGNNFVAELIDECDGG
jgi:hypothetical protein